MAAHVLISYTLLFSPIVVAVRAFFFNNLSCVFLHYTKVYYLIYIGALGDNKTRHSRAQFGLVIVSNKSTLDGMLINMECMWFSKGRYFYGPFHQNKPKIEAQASRGKSWKVAWA